MTEVVLPGALVISLDFELYWGVRDVFSVDGPYRQNLLGVRQAVPRMLALFEEFGIAVTWATVGFLFAHSREELERFSPRLRPCYRNVALNPYVEAVGAGEDSDPLHFGPSLIQAIRNTPRQEISTHTFSHYYCLEAGQSREAFAADLDSAVRIAECYDIPIHSIVFPRNQHNPSYERVLIDAGIRCYRGNQPARMYRSDRQGMRASRLLDTYVNLGGAHTVRWNEVPQENGLCNLPASFFLRPYSPSLRYMEPLRQRRIARSIRRAALHKEIIHLWWHPHNFGIYIDENMAVLRQVLTTFARYRDSNGMCSLSMSDAAGAARGAAARAQ